MLTLLIFGVYTSKWYLRKAEDLGYPLQAYIFFSKITFKLCMKCIKIF